MNDFNECLEFSLGEREKFDISLLKPYFPKKAKIYKTPTDIDKKGADYAVELPGGAVKYIDAKARTPNSKRYWKHGEPELIIEQYSIVEDKTVGWLFKNSDVRPDYILYTFDKSDTDRFYLIPFVLLHKASWDNWKKWENRYGIRFQPNTGTNGRKYHSSGIFVPASVLISAVTELMSGTI